MHQFLTGDSNLTEITGETSDGYHTFNELYEHRHALFVKLAMSNPPISWKSRANSDGSKWDGWFVAGMELPSGGISYHLPDKLWEGFDVKELDKGIWDGHSSKDVVDRLNQWEV